MKNIEKFEHYLDRYQNKDIESVSDMLSEQVQLRDWKISVKGKEHAISETRKNFDNAKNIDITILNCMENKNSVSGELEIVVDNSERLFVVDVVNFDDDGLISSIRAYIGRED